MNTQEVVYVSAWNGGFEVKTKALLNVETLKVTDIESSDIQVDADGDELEHLDGQYVLWGTERIEVLEDAQGGYFVNPEPETINKMRAAATPQEPEMATMMTLSTMHIDEESMKFLDSGDRQALVTYKKDEFGWFIYLDYDTVDEDIEYSPKPLQDVLRFAQESNCGLLCLDHDGPVVAKLTIYLQD